MQRIIEITNCNCIKTGKVTIVDNHLNIKYGINGTGKSTIGKAIRGALSSNPKEELLKLLPYGSDSELDPPCVTGLSGYSGVSVFNEEYAEHFAIKDSSLLDNSFEIFLKTPESDTISEEINKQLNELVSAIKNQPDYSDIYRMLSSAMSETIRMTGSRIAKTGGLGEVIKGNGYGFEKHADLMPYKSYYGAADFSMVTKWANWRREGNKLLIGSPTCPFCAGDMDIPRIEEQNTSIEAVFKTSALKTANELIEFMDGIMEKGIADPTAITRLKSNLGDPNKTDEIEGDLSRLGSETRYLLKKIDKILSLQPSNISREDIQNLSDTLESMKIEPAQVGLFYNTTRVSSLISDVNAQIDNLSTITGVLKGLFFKYDSKLTDLISKRQQDINQFFRLAGFPYEFCLKPQGNENAIAFLRPISGAVEKVDSLGKHLSWGELNSFSLIMFMFQAVADKSDLIILDDPIYSFDANKKFAIFHRLFNDREEVSFSGKTVLMLTHDAQPLLDYVRSGLRRNYGISIPITATYLKTVDTKLTEREILPDDLKSIIDISNSIAKDISLPTACRIVNMRKHLECSHADLYHCYPYHIVSSLIHDRPRATFQDETQLDDRCVNIGCHELESLFSIDSFEYSAWRVSLSKDSLLTDYRNADAYSKTLIARLLLERHPEVSRALRKTYPGLCKFLHESNHIENDYIFQLDPRKFFSVPDDYEKELDKVVTEWFSSVIN